MEKLLIEYILSGFSFGFVAGISPGPLLTLVITETVKHNKKAGITVAVAPVITDIPIILFSVFILSKIAQSDTILGIIAFAGAIFIGYLCYESVTVKGIDLDYSQSSSNSLIKAVITNLLNPHPYIFWIAVGAPVIINANKISIINSVIFISGFYISLISSKICIALIADKTKSLLKHKAYIIIVRITGIVMGIFAVIFLIKGLELCGLL